MAAGSEAELKTLYATMEANLNFQKNKVAVSFDQISELKQQVEKLAEEDRVK
jgi:hypothetical protein